MYTYKEELNEYVSFHPLSSIRNSAKAWCGASQVNIMRHDWFLDLLFCQSTTENTSWVIVSSFKGIFSDPK